MRDEEGNLLPFRRNNRLVDIFTSHGDKLIYPSVYWYEGDYLFPYLEKIIEKNNIDMIIGYSAGGHTGYHLCNKYKLLGLHFNPAIAPTSEAPTLQILPDSYKSNKIFGKQLMIIGERDRKNIGGVDGHLVIENLERTGYFKAGGDIIVIPELVHEVPISLFAKAFDYFRDEYC